jgi:hypothetical protein
MSFVSSCALQSFPVSFLESLQQMSRQGHHACWEAQEPVTGEELQVVASRACLKYPQLRLLHEDEPGENGGLLWAYLAI